MAITYVGVGTTAVDSTAGGTSTPGLPTGWQQDDVAILVLGARFRSEFLPGGPSVSAGWTLVDSDYYDLGTANDPFLFIYRRVLQSGDSAPTVTNTNDTGLPNEMVISFIVAFRGVDTTTPIDVTSVSDTSAAGATFTPTGLTTTTNDAWVLSSVISADDNTLGLLSGSEQGFTVRATDETTIGNDASIGIASKEITTAGSVTNPTWEQTVNEPDSWVAITLALRPAGGAATVTGTAAGTAAASGTVAGTRTVLGTASGNAAATGSVTGTRTTSGTATGTTDASGTVVGVRTTSGTAAGNAAASGAATGIRTVLGSASGAASATGTVTGTRTTSGTASGNADAAGTIVGTRTALGTASGNAAATGTATGTSSGAGSGTASGNAAAAGTATGTRTTFGNASGNADAAGTATGTRTVLGIASSTAAATGTATGTKTVTGIAAAVWGGVTGTATGTRTVFGAATGDTGPFTGTVIERLVGTVQFASRPPRRRYAADRVGRAFAASTTRRRFDADRPRRSP